MPENALTLRAVVLPDFDALVGGCMSRADVAAFLVGQLTGERYLHAVPAISN